MALDITKHQWLRQHIQTRMLALQANLYVLRERQSQVAPDRPFEKYQFECLFHAAWEGRHAAARWLIEFVGITGLKNGKPLNPGIPTRHRGYREDEHVFRIVDLGGPLFDINSPEALKLAMLRRDVIKATAHPTHLSGHDYISEPRLGEAAIILKTFLQNQLYMPAGETLY